MEEIYEVYQNEIDTELTFAPAISQEEAISRAAHKKQLRRRGYIYVSVEGIRHKITLDELGGVSCTPVPKD